MERENFAKVRYFFHRMRNVSQNIFSIRDRLHISDSRPDHFIAAAKL